MDESRKQFEEWFMEKHDIAAGVLNYCHDAVVSMGRISRSYRDKTR
jgi:hypothetical protein